MQRNSSLHHLRRVGLTLRTSRARCPDRSPTQLVSFVTRRAQRASVGVMSSRGSCITPSMDGGQALLPSPSSVPSHLTHFARPQQQSRGDSTLPQRTGAPLGDGQTAALTHPGVAEELRLPAASSLDGRVLAGVDRVGSV